MPVGEEQPQQKDHVNVSHLHLESKIRSQRRELQLCNQRLRERNVHMRAWYEGRENLLRQMLRDKTNEMYAWKKEAEENKRLVRELLDATKK